ncbi:MAG TPA: cytochrome c oxidase subunit II [Phycisphaerales bacterium]|nr:cytochrome c oxidase subunit II [Phycisphaerales bacterium]
MNGAMLSILKLMLAQTAATAPAAAADNAIKAGPVMTSSPDQSTWSRFWFEPGASTFSHEVDFVFSFITWICIFFFVLIVVLMLWFMWKYRQRAHEGASSQITHNTPLELTWTIIPLILVIAIFYVGMEGYIKLRRAPSDSYVINVTGQQWSWAFQYPDGSSPQDLYLPLGRPVKLMMTSNDVLHAFYIPAFRVKQDVVPGKYSTIWFQPDHEGTYQFFCAEYCGKDHSQMAGKVMVLNEADFEKALAESKKVPEGSEVELGRWALDHIYPRCQSCHTLNGSTSTGPTWKGLYKRLSEQGEVFADGTDLKNEIGEGKEYSVLEEYLRESVLAPQKKTVANYSASAMPTFQGVLKEAQIRAVIDLIKHLGEIVDDNGKPIGEAK